MRISDWSSDVCSSDLLAVAYVLWLQHEGALAFRAFLARIDELDQILDLAIEDIDADHAGVAAPMPVAEIAAPGGFGPDQRIHRKRVVTGKSGADGLDLGGRRIIQKQNKHITNK